MTEIVSLKIKEEGTGAWRQVVVRCSTTLYNLHRVIQLVTKKKRPSEEFMSEMKPEFTYKTGRWTKRGDLNLYTLENLDAPPTPEERRQRASGPQPRPAMCEPSLGEQFLAGKGQLECTVGGARYSIKAGKCGVCEGKPHYVPRCFRGSADAKLDDINRRLLVTRFHHIQSYNREPRALPGWMWYKGSPKLWSVYLSLMRRTMRAER